VLIIVDVRLRYFVQYSISVNINFIQFPRCSSLFWHCKNGCFSLTFYIAESQHSLCIWARKVLHWAERGKSHKPNSSFGIRDFTHALQTSTHSAIAASCSVNSLPLTCDVKSLILPLNSDCIAASHYSNTALYSESLTIIFVLLRHIAEVTTAAQIYVSPILLLLIDGEKNW